MTPPPSAPHSRLALPDELLLLALDDDRGTRAHANELEPGLAGAVLLDLALRGRLDVVDKTVRAIDATSTGDAVLDHALAAIADAPKLRAPKWWVTHLQKGVREQVADRLVASGALRRDEQRLLWIFPVTRLPAGDPGPESAVRARLDGAVLQDVTPDDRTAALAALVHATNLRSTVFPGVDRRAVKERLAELAEGQWAAEAVRRAVQEMAAATTVAATTAATAAATSGGS